MKKIILSITVIAFLLSSCTTGSRLAVTKKYHSFGWNIEFETNKKSNANNDYVAKKATKKQQETNNETNFISEVEDNVIISNDVVSNNEVANNAPKVNNELSTKVNTFVKENNISENNNSTPLVKENKLTKFAKKIATKATGSDDDWLIALLLTIFGFSPLGMWFYEGREWTKRCTLNLILWLLCGLPGFIHALIIILGKK